MKIENLRLRAFGPFTDKAVDFSCRGHGLHIVFGPNEAGKSTTLRAMLGLLYGFGHKIEDAWLHDYKKLEVGGALRLSDGRLLNLARYKRRKNDLIDEDTGTPLDQAELDAVLGKMDRQAFEHAFGISHQSLRQGVESVLAAGGELGHALFAATSGLNVLKQVMTGLEDQQNGLFRPRAQKAVINADLSKLEDLKKELRAASASQHQWQKLQNRLDDLGSREAEAANLLETKASEISLLSRYRDAFRHVTRRDELQNALKYLGPGPDLAEDFAQRRVEVQVKLKTAEQAEQNLNRELADIDQQLETLVYDEQVIAHTNIIKELAKDVSVHTTALADMKTLRSEIYRHNESVQKHIRLLRAGLTLENVEALRLSTADKSKLQRLGSRFAKLEEASGQAQKALETAEADLAGASEKLDRLASPRDTAPLEACLERAGALGKIESQLSQAQLDYASALEQAKADVAALGLWSGDLEALEKLALPPAETMRRFEAAFFEADRNLEEIKKEGIRLKRELSKNEKALSDLVEVRELPSSKDLQAHRALRERGWRSVRAVWLEQGQPDQGFMDAFADRNDLAGAYEKAVSLADDTADILRVDAEDVARAQALRAGIRQLTDNLAENTRRQKGVETSRAAQRDEWEHLWRPLGIVPLPPREMDAWSAQVVEIRRKAADCRRKKHTAAQLKADLERIVAELIARLKELGDALPDTPDYAGLLDRARRIRRDNEQLIKARQSLESEVAGCNRLISDNLRRKEDAEQELKTWARQWTPVVGKLGFAADATPEDVNDFVLALDEVFSELETADGKQRRIAAMQANYEKYTDRVRDLMNNLALKIDAADPALAVVELHDRLDADQNRYKERKLLQAQRKKLRADVSKVREVLAAERETLRLLCEDAQADGPEELPEIEKRATEKSRLTANLDAVHERLAELASGQELAAFVAEVHAHDPDELSARLDRLDQEKKELQQELKQLVEDLALQKKELETIGGHSQAAAIAETVEGLTGKIEADVEHYVRLKLSATILAQAIERYRQKNQSPVLDAASTYFKTMTRGAFEGLRADYDDKGDPVIKAFRQDGRTLMVPEMSDGSRDQLFLALRLGGLEKHIKTNGPMPFIVDDVLVHFDDERSGAALIGMARLAKNTQIIFFTHHRHLVDLAKGTLDEDILNVHFL